MPDSGFKSREIELSVRAIGNGEPTQIEIQIRTMTDKRLGQKYASFTLTQEAAEAFAKALLEVNHENDKLYEGTKWI